MSSEPGQVWILADPVRLEQVIESLLTNAAKFTDPADISGSRSDVKAIKPR